MLNDRASTHEPVASAQNWKSDTPTAGMDTSDLDFDSLCT
jgi:hypothetical protein